VIGRASNSPERPKGVLERDGTLFGATVLGTPTLHTWFSRAALRQNNRLRFFDSLADTEDQLRNSWRIRL
jgi:hypothetical protein